MVGNHQRKVDFVATLPYNNIEPKLDEDVFIADGAKVIGNVKIGKRSSVWFNSIVRGDVNYISIGTYTNVQDLSILHVTNEYPLIIGNYVTIGHSAKLHGCVVKDNSLIGIGSTVLDNAVVSENCIIAAGALILQNMVVPSGKLIAGVPGKIVRDLTDEEIRQIRILAENYFQYSQETIRSINKDQSIL